MLSRASNVSSVAPHPPHLVKQFEPQPGLGTQEHAQESPVAMEQKEAHWTSSDCLSPLAGPPAASHVAAVQPWALAPTAFAVQHGSFTSTSALPLHAGSGSPACATGVGGLSSA